MDKLTILNLIIPVLTAFLASFLTYVFGIKNMNRSVDLDKSKELNKVLADLLRVWHNLSTIKKAIRLITSESTEIIIPRKYLPIILLKQGFIHDECFGDLNESIKDLKKYDPITYYRFENIGELFSKIKSDFIMPFFNENLLESDINSIDLGAGTLLNRTLREIQEAISAITLLVENKKTVKEVKEIVNSYLELTEEEFIMDINGVIYEYFIEILPDELKKISFDDFMEFAATAEFKEMIEFQFKVVAKGNFEAILNLVSENPDISIDELNKLI